MRFAGMNTLTACICSTLCVFGLLALCSPADAATPTPEAQQRAAERASIAAERADVNARFEARQRACRAQFVVTSCVDEAAETRRLALTRLHARELDLADAQRHENAAARQAALAARAAASEPRAGDAASAPPRVAPHATKAPNPAAAMRGNNGGRAKGESVQARRLQEERNQAAFEAKARAAEAHRESVLRRNAARAASGKVVTPLSLPGAASAP